MHIDGVQRMLSAQLSLLRGSVKSNHAGTNGAHVCLYRHWPEQTFPEDPAHAHQSSRPLQVQ